MLVAFTGWTAQQESQRRSDCIRAGLARRRAEGRHVGRQPGSTDKKPRKRADTSRPGKAAGAALPMTPAQRGNEPAPVARRPTPAQQRAGSPHGEQLGQPPRRKDWWAVNVIWPVIRYMGGRTLRQRCSCRATSIRRPGRPGVGRDGFMNMSPLVRAADSPWHGRWLLRKANSQCVRQSAIR